MSPEAVLKVGDVVRVRDEQGLSAVALRPDGPAAPPPDCPDLDGVCCVAVVLVRTPPDEGGVLRWVVREDVTRVPAEPADE